MEDGADKDCAAQPQRPIERQPIVGASGQANDFACQAGKIGQDLFGGGRPAEHRLCFRQKEASGLRQHDPAPNPIEQLRRITRLKRGDCGARRRLSQIEMSRALCDVLEFSHGDKMRSCSRVTTPIPAVSWVSLFEFID